MSLLPILAAVLVAAGCGTSSGVPTAPSAAAAAVRTAAGSEGAQAVACQGGLLAPTDAAGAVEPVTPGLVRERRVAIDVARLAQLATSGAPLPFNLFDDTCVVGLPDDLTELGSETFTWTGHDSQATEGAPIVVVVHESSVEASLRVAGGAVYRITDLGLGVHAVLQINPSAFPPD